MIVSSRKINTALISCFLIFFFAVANKLVVFGSKAGLWVYPYIADISRGP